MLCRHHGIGKSLPGRSLGSGYLRCRWIRSPGPRLGRGRRVLDGRLLRGIGSVWGRQLFGRRSALFLARPFVGPFGRRSTFCSCGGGRSVGRRDHTSCFCPGDRVWF